MVQMTQRIAIIGSGVAGLVAAAKLHPDHAITLFEANDYLGGHTHTVTVQDHGKDLAIDTGFIVFNEENYPQFTRLLQQLEVDSQPSEMSFAVSCQECKIQYSSRGLSGLFPDWRQFFDPRVYRMAADILRFNHWAVNTDVHQIASNATLGSLRNDGRFDEQFFQHYLFPMTGAIWSSTLDDLEDFPLALFLMFFKNHGLLRVRNHSLWRTVTGGSHTYVNALAQPFLDRVRLKTPVNAVQRRSDCVNLRTVDGGWESFDTVVIATHADQALAMLEHPDDHEVKTLSQIKSRRNIAVLHTDASVLPKSPPAQASWNCHVCNCGNSDLPLRMTYYMNRLQQLDTKTPYLVTLNAEDQISPSHIIDQYIYDHPLYTIGGVRAREAIRTANGRRHTYYCGAYLGNGFHEDGVVAGLDVYRAINDRKEVA